jgi:hypothetical protein
MKRPQLSGMTLAIIAVSVLLVLGIAGPYLPGALSWVTRLFQGKAALQGDIFVTMKSGDVKRGADVEVGVVRVDEELVKGWEAILADYDTAAATAIRQRSENRRTRADALSAVGRYDEALAVLSEADRDPDPLRDIREPFRQRARALIGPRLVTTVRTSAEGHFRFVDLPPGRYLVVAQHKVFDTALRWAVQTSLQSGENTLNLTTSNGNSPIP